MPKTMAGEWERLRERAKLSGPDLEVYRSLYLAGAAAMHRLVVEGLAEAKDNPEAAELLVRLGDELRGWLETREGHSR